MPGTYQYEPGNIAEYGKDRMRFELGDVMVEGKEKTCAMRNTMRYFQKRFQLQGNGKRQNSDVLKALCVSLHSNLIRK